MLYDPKWEALVKADPFKIETLIAWLETQPADLSYDFLNTTGECLLAQYFKAQGVDWVDAYCDLLSKDDRHIHDDVVGRRPWTFGAALERARKLVPVKEAAQ